VGESGAVLLGLHWPSPELARTGLSLERHFRTERSHAPGNARGREALRHREIVAWTRAVRWSPRSSDALQSCLPPCLCPVSRQCLVSSGWMRRQSARYSTSGHSNNSGLGNGL